VWKGSKEAQWLSLVANDMPVTVWNHDSIKNFRTIITAADPGESVEELDLTEKRIGETLQGDQDVPVAEYKTWQSARELVGNLNTDRVNVINVPGLAGDADLDHPYYFYLWTWKDILEAVKDRDYLRFIVVLMDELNDVFPSQQELTKPFWGVVAKYMPKILGQMRKNNAFLYGAAHSTHDCHHVFWKVKSNSIIYMSGANIDKAKSPDIEQAEVNKYSRGQFVMPGFTVANFGELATPRDLLWVPDSPYRKVRVRWAADVPDLLEETEEEEDVDPKEVRQEYKTGLAKHMYEELGWRQSDIAEVLEVQQPQVSKLVNSD